MSLLSGGMGWRRKGGTKMRAHSRLAAATVAVSMLAGAGGGIASADANSSLAESMNLAPRRNADGNYNIIFITTDQERYIKDFPAGTAYEARELLASLGATFEKHYACATMSTSSRSVIFTGKHITDTKMIDNTDFPWQGPLSKEMTTVGDRMRTAGFYSALKGKWHLGNASTLEDVEDELTDLDEHGFSDWDVDGDYIGTMWEGYNKDEEIVTDTVAWLRNVGAVQNAAGKSFFLAANLINPHDIMYFCVDEEFVGPVPVGGAPDDPLYTKTYDEPLPSSWNRDVSDGTVPAAVSIFKNFMNKQTGVLSTEEEWKETQDYYFNCIQDNDNHLIDLLLAVRDMGMLDNSIIFFTSDHGEMGGEHGLKGKGGLLFERNMHVPLIVYHPDYEGGRSVNAVTSHIDLATTFIHMSGLSAERKAEVAEGLPGKNLMELIDGTSQSVRRGALFCNELISTTMARAVRDVNGAIQYYTFDTTVRGLVRAAITERYKFARYFGGNFNTPTTMEALLRDNDIELYDLENDPGELNNLALDPEANAELIMEMNALLNELIASEIGEDNGDEFHEMIAAYNATLRKESGGCSTASVPAGLLLLLALLPLLRRRK